MAQHVDLNANLVRRSQLLQAIRRFFLEREFVEVETPLVAAEVIPELHIEPFTVGQQFLQASPELHMKRLVAGGMSAIFQITRSFRADELGPLHSPEFTIVEWYRTGDDLHAGMQLLDELCQAALSVPSAKRISYAAAFQQYVGINPHTASVNELAARTSELQLAVPDALRINDRDEWLNLLLSFCVEPHLGRDAPELLYEYPANQAALAEIAKSDDGVEVAKRFELYYRGVELANGYQELTDGGVLRTRLNDVNRQRQADGRQKLPLPESLLAAMDEGLPPCAGCALGFDRLAMIACGAEAIDHVRAFPSTVCYHQLDSHG